jgi:16S rRNA (cytidine1402-2'-O)-methyltransferase
LEALVKHLPGTKKVVIARELTKVFEETVEGSATEVLEYFKSNGDKVRGEFVVIIS